VLDSRAVSRNAPVVDDERQVDRRAAPSGGFQRRLDRRAKAHQRDVFAVGVLTPALLVALVAGVLATSQLFYPDTYVEPTAASTPTFAPDQPTPTPTVVILPIDTARLNAGIVDKPPAFDWPNVPDLKVVPNPGRPNEQADYTPTLAATDTRRLVADASVSLVLHQTPQFAQGATEELVKSYPLRSTKQRVIDLQATLGYLPDESGLGLVLTYQSYRLQIETIAANPPIKPGQRGDAEGFTLHLADHIVRRLQEVTSGGRRTAPEDYAVHLRDHISRMLPFSR
jgi:hypothetical protein